MKSLVRAVLGLVVVLGWWTLTGNRVSEAPVTAVPPSVWGGGKGTLEIEVETTSPAEMRVSFDRDETEESLESVEKVGAGVHRWTIDVPEDVGGYIELGAIDPRPGDRLDLSIRVDGRLVFEDSDELETALEPGYAFFVQAYFDEYAEGELSED